MKKIVQSVILIMACSWLTGCVNTKPIKDNQGSILYAIDCSGSGANWTQCFDQAARLCPGNYQVIDGGSMEPNPASPSYEKNDDIYQATAGPVFYRTITIRCLP